MKVVSVTPGATAASLKSLSSRIPTEVSILFLQAPNANSGLINYGDSAAQPFELDGGGLPQDVPCYQREGRVNTEELYVKGNGSDKLSVMWVGYGDSE
jgi:hypothetical protein